VVPGPDDPDVAGELGVLPEEPVTPEVPVTPVDPVTPDGSVPAVDPVPGELVTGLTGGGSFANGCCAPVPPNAITTPVTTAAATPAPAVASAHGRANRPHSPQDELEPAAAAAPPAPAP
jgi:hypothetical protein